MPACNGYAWAERMMREYSTLDAFHLAGDPDTIRLVEKQPIEPDHEAYGSRFLHFTLYPPPPPPHLLKGDASSSSLRPDTPHHVVVKHCQSAVPSTLPRCRRSLNPKRSPGGAAAPHVGGAASSSHRPPCRPGEKTPLSDAETLETPQTDCVGAAWGSACTAGKPATPAVTGAQSERGGGGV